MRFAKGIKGSTGILLVTRAVATENYSFNTNYRSIRLFFLCLQLYEYAAEGSQISFAIGNIFEKALTIIEVFAYIEYLKPQLCVSTLERRQLFLVFSITEVLLIICFSIKLDQFLKLI